MMIGFHFLAGPTIGTGHARRCAVLAQVFADTGHEVFLASNTETMPFAKPHLPKTCTFFEVGPSPTDVTDSVRDEGPEVFIVDRYDFTPSDEGTLRSHTYCLLVLDDFVARDHDCDVLLDQNLGRTARQWSHLRDRGTKILAGAQYALLRPEFSEMRKPALRRDRSSQKVPRIFICFGGYDSQGMTYWLAKALAPALSTKAEVDIVVGSGSRDLNPLAELACSNNSVSLHVDSTDVAEMMSRADLAIGAPGSMNLERACLSLPAVLVSNAENQLAVGREIDRLGIARYLGDWRDIEADQLVQTVFTLLADKRTIAEMRARASQTTDGLGSTRVMEAVLASIGGATGQAPQPMPIDSGEVQSDA